jgi:hypothetical protein
MIRFCLKCIKEGIRARMYWMTLKRKTTISIGHIINSVTANITPYYKSLRPFRTSSILILGKLNAGQNALFLGALWQHKKQT